MIFGVMGDDSVFRAMADPTRRLLLDRLFERDGRTLGELQEQVADMTRFGVMKHLGVLEQVGLITTRKVGREKLHFLNPVPIQLIHDRWVSKYTRGRAEALSDLKAALEGGTRMNSATTTKPQQVYHVFIRATPQQVWDAITRPEFTSRYFYGSHIDPDLKVGGPYRSYSDPGQESVLVEGEVLELDQPRRFVHTWHALYDPATAADPPSRVTWEIEPADGGVCKLTVVHDGFEDENATYKSVSGGWEWILSNMKSLLETGEPLPAGTDI
jgi:uncharacterized protein YndB with AHSA1/START domain/DNA-binding transcriptional ArsR family regulator